MLITENNFYNYNFVIILEKNGSEQEKTALKMWEKKNEETKE